VLSSRPSVAPMISYKCDATSGGGTRTGTVEPQKYARMSRSVENSCTEPDTNAYNRLVRSSIVFRLTKRFPCANGGKLAEPNMVITGNNEPALGARGHPTSRLK
jgi:hypothetical protein